MNSLTHADWQALAAHHVHNVRQLTARVLKDQDFLNQFAPDTAGRMRTAVSNVIVERSRVFTEGRFRKHLIDALVLIALGLIATALWRDFHVPSSQAVVGRSGGLEPFHVIVSSDLRLNCDSNDSPSPAAMEKIVGRYSPKYLKTCAHIDPKMLSSGPRLSSEVNARIVVRLKVQPTIVFTNMHPPFKAALMISPSERATTALLLNDVIVLDLQKDGADLAAVVAVPSSDESTLASFVARSEIFLVAGQP
jgi:hypothetical protein